MPRSWYRKLVPAILAIGAFLALVPAAASAADPPDPLDRGPYAAERLDPFKVGEATLQEPNSGGGAPGSGSNSSITLEVRGSAFVPVGKPGKSPVIVLVHGNHGSCDSGSAPACTFFKRNDEGYAYLAENLATWGYSVFSLDQDQMMSRQDGSFGKGMHQRRLLIAALLDGLYAANDGTLPAGPAVQNVAGLVGKLDFTRIGMMGHSRGGDAVSSFIEYNRMRPEGRRYPLRGVISLAPVDYERRAPYGTPYMTILPMCDGDVSNLQGARLYERGQHREEAAYPLIQSAQLGGNHNWYNSVWFADANLSTGSGDDANGEDAACRFTNNPTSIRLSGQAGTGPTESYVIDNSDKLNPLVNTRISGDPARMGDQEKIGLATMSAFFRRYVGGEGAFEPYLTGELAAAGKPQIPQSACPTSESGVRIQCIDRVATSYFAPADERLDVIEPDTEMPLAKSSLGSRLSASGFANPYVKGGGVVPRPEKTASGLAWCNPDPWQTETGQLGEAGYPAASNPCPLPNPTALGGQSGTRENAPVNQSYGRQLAVAWEGPATLGTKIPHAFSDVSGYKALTLAAGVNFFDPRNPTRSTTDPQVGEQNFLIAVADGEGNLAEVPAGDPRYGTALQQTQGATSSKVHVVLRDIRVPLSDIAAAGVDLTDVRRLELRFGEPGMPATGSIQLSDIRFQEAVAGTDVLLDSTAPNAGPGEGEPASGPNPVEELEDYDRTPGQMELPEVELVNGANTWVVDDNGAQCPNAQFDSIQAAVNYASPWDKIVVCPGLYEEKSVPINSAANPVAPAARNGLTINKPLKIKGAGAGLVTIKPAAGLGGSLLGSEQFLRDGGGNVVTISRQSLGSSDFNENYTEITGVTIESPSAYVDAGVAFFNTSGRIADSVIGPLRISTSAATLPHSWGVIATNSLLGQGEGTIERHVTVDRTKVSGYKTGGILFDDSTGADAAASATQPSGIKLYGYVTDSVVDGAGALTSYAQTGIQYHAGAAGYVEDSEITDHLFTPALPTDPQLSYGILLTGANTGDLHLSGSVLKGNGYGLFNADVTKSAVREGAPAEAAGNFWGNGGDPVVGPSTAGSEGISGPDSTPAPSVLFAPSLGSAPAVAGPQAIPDAGPIGAIVDPGDGETVEAGEVAEPVVFTEDDFGIKSVALTADGVPVETIAGAPYAFAWTPSVADIGSEVELEATITDSSGQQVTSTLSVEVIKSSADEEAEEKQKEEEEAEEAAEKAAEEAQKAKEDAEAAQKAAEAEATGAKEQAEAALNAAKKEAAEARVAAEAALALARAEGFGPGKVVKNKKQGSARLTVEVPVPGELVVSGPAIKKVTRNVTSTGNVRVLIKAKGKALKTLNEEGKVKVEVQIAYSPPGIATLTKKTTVVLVKR